MRVTQRFNIVLIGYRATGKTTIGEALAKKMNLPLLSIDKLIVNKKGMPLTEIVKRFGWAEFRRIETQIAKEVSELDNQVIDCGGGIIEVEENIQFLKKKGKILLLVADFKDIVRRLKKDSGRPAFSNDLSLEEETKRMMFKRKDRYKAAADVTINTSRFDLYTKKGVFACIDEITRLLN